MLQPHQIYGWQMSARKALALLRQSGEVTRLQARQLDSLLRSPPLDNALIPESLVPVCLKLYLAEVAPANLLPA